MPSDSVRFGHSISDMADDAESFVDLLPTMAKMLGEKDFMDELCRGFRLLADSDCGLITFRSLKTNARLLGVNELSDGQLRAMIAEGDIDGDGMLTDFEFCLLMLRLSPCLLHQGRPWLYDRLLQSFIAERKP